MPETQFSPMRSLHRLDIAIRRELEKGDGVQCFQEATGSNGHIILFLSSHEGEPIYQKDLETEFGITRSTVSRILRLMEQKGLITRSGVSGDARLKRIELTQKSRDLTAMIRRNGQRVEEMLLTGFSEQEKIQFCEYLERIKNNLTKE